MYKPAAIILLILLGSIQQAIAQKAKYGNATMGKSLQIVGTIANSIHVWSGPFKQSSGYLKKTTLTIHVFSRALELQTEKKIDLGKIRFWSVSFMVTDSCYYADLRYVKDLNERLLLKVHPDGSFEDVSDLPHLWKDPNILEQLTRDYSVIRNEKYFYTVRTENYNENLMPSRDTFNLINDSKSNEKGNLNQILFRRANIGNKTMTEKIYANRGYRFVYPLITPIDNGIIACSYIIPDNDGPKSKFRISPFMFVAQLDSNLVEINSPPSLLRGNNRQKNQLFIPSKIFPFNNRICIISMGQDLKQTFSNPFGYYITGSLRFTIADNQLNLLKDSIIAGDSKNHNLLFQNRFMEAAENRVDLFCIQKYTGSKSGISYIIIDNNGKVSEREMIVDERYDYFLNWSKLIAPGVLLVPCQRKGNMTVLKLEYTNADQ